MSNQEGLEETLKILVAMKNEINEHVRDTDLILRAVLGQDSLEYQRAKSVWIPGVTQLIEGDNVISSMALSIEEVQDIMNRNE